MIELTEYEAELFKSFMEYHDKFMVLKESGVLDSIMAEVVLNFDSAGNITRIKKDSVVYLRKELTKVNIVV